LEDLVLQEETKQESANSIQRKNPPSVRGSAWKIIGRFAVILVLGASAVASGTGATGPGGGNAAAIEGVITDPTGAVVPGATVEIQNPVSQFTRTATSDGDGKFSFTNVPPNNYHLTARALGFVTHTEDIDVRSSVPLSLTVALQIGGAAETVTVQGEAGDLVETDPTFHSDVDRQLFDRLPLESSSSEVSSLVTLATPGVSADSNGMFHGMGEHADNSFSLDGQPITDQQSKTFSNQIPLDAVQSMEVIAGAPPAEYGDKTSLVIDVTTRSGVGATTPHGNITTSYGTFGSSNVNANFSYGQKNWGNFFSASGLDTGRFLDPPELVVFHGHGNQENFFDRFDYVFSQNDAMHINAGFTRSWFQTPNSYDSQNYGVVGPDGNLVGPADQRSKILTFNIAPSWTHTINNNSVFTLVGFVRRDDFHYYPSQNPFADFSPIQSSSIAQQRSLLNAGARADLTWSKGINNVKAGVSYTQTFLDENDQIGIVNPTLNSPCVDANGNPVPGLNSTAQCAAAGYFPNPAYTSILSCYDLTRPFPPPSAGCASPHSTFYPFVGHTDVKELALYVQDNINYKNWNFSLGIRGDLYNGLTTASQAEPRVGIAYNIHRTNTVLRLSYARTLDTPYNENLILSSTGCFYPVIAALVPCVPTPLAAGYRNEFHAGLQQALGKYVVVSGEYIWKYTHNAFDFSVLDNTPITFPIEWHNSKVPGWALRVSVPTIHGFTALAVMSSVSSRLFPPQVGGLGVVPAQNGYPFLADHDEHFNQTLHMQYQFKPDWFWVGFNWRYDSGQVAGAAPCYGVLPFNTCPDSTTLPNGLPAVDLSGLTADQQFQGGLFCGNVKASPFASLPSQCPVGQYGSTLLSIPLPNTQNNDKNPARMASRNLFDISIGDDNLFKGDRYKWSLQVTVVNLTNKEALYNYLSTFSGTHYVSPRTVTAQLGFHF
jgi:hypothetical protein